MSVLKTLPTAGFVVIVVIAVLFILAVALLLFVCSRYRRLSAGSSEHADPSAKDQDLLTTLEAVYEFYLRGFSFLNIDIYKSDSTRFLIEDGKLRPPFVAISGLGDAAAEDLKKCRERGWDFVSVDDISDACPKVSKAHIEQLKNLGALGDLPESRQVSLFDGF